MDERISGLWYDYKRGRISGTSTARFRNEFLGYYLWVSETFLGEKNTSVSLLRRKLWFLAALEFLAEYLDQNIWDRL